MVKPMVNGKWDRNICHFSEIRDGKNCVAYVGMGWEHLGGRRDRKKIGNTPYGGMRNSQDENKTPQVRTVDGGNKDRGREGVGKSRSGTKYTRDSRSCPDPFPTRLHFPDPIITARTLAIDRRKYEGWGGLAGRQRYPQADLNQPRP